MTAEILIGLTYADRLRLAAEARHQSIETLLNGQIASLTSLMGPMTEGPEWPAGAAWLAAWRNEHACVISDGLSDPWVERDRPETGLGLEVFIESPDAGIASDQPATALANTWLFPMLAEISHMLAGYPRLSARLLADEILSMELNIEHIKDGRGRLGVLLSAPTDQPTDLSLPGGKIKLIAATLLTADERVYLHGKGEPARRELATRLQEAGIGHLSLLRRPSLL